MDSKCTESWSRSRRCSLGAAIEAAVIAKLDGTDVSQAAGLFAERGGPAAEKALAKKLDALRGDAALAVPRALTHGKAWMTLPSRLREIQAQCDEACRREAQGMIDRWGEGGARPAFVLWSTRPNGGVVGWLGHYDLRSANDVERRIAELPKGTTLVWQTKPEDVDPALWADVERWARARGVTIVKGP